MRKLLFTLVLTSMSSWAFSQPTMARHTIDFSLYEKTDTLPLEMVYFKAKEGIDGDGVIDLGSGYYMAKMPHKDNFIIKTNANRTKAIVVYNSFVFGSHREFTVKEDERRITLYTEKPYCGYVYDKKLKVCHYYTSRKHYKAFMRFGMRHKPHKSR